MMDEFEIIDAIRAKVAEKCCLAQKYNRVDDAAIISKSNDKIIISVDASYENVHFPADAKPQLIGNRAVLVAASDLAAMGAKPKAMLLSLQLPDHRKHKGSEYHSTDYINALAAGIADASARLSLPLIGGDLIAADALGLSFTVIGEAQEAILRAGAQPGDGIYVSGNLGDAMAGLKYAMSSPRNLTTAQASLRAAYYCPNPRLALGMALSGIASSCIDLSDGLISGIRDLCGHSKSKSAQAEAGLGAEIFLDKLPYSQSLHQEMSANTEEIIDHILAGGDDYELLWTMPTAKQPLIDKLKSQAKTKISCIGKITDTGQIIGTYLDSRADSKGSKTRSLDKLSSYKHFDQ